MLSNNQSGLLQSVTAFTIWGFFPLYWFFLKDLSAEEIMANRIVWSFLMLILFMLATQKKHRISQGLRDRKVMLILPITALLISGNWIVYIWSVTNDRILESSMGYYINPIISIILGAIFLGEKLRKYQWLAVAFVSVGILIITIAYGKIPFIALSLAVLFGLYGLLRKVTPVGAQAGLVIETGFVFLPALIYLLFLKGENHLFFGSFSEKVLLIGSGFITLIPLLLMASALKLLPLSTIGFIQYISPTLQFLFGLFVFNEPFDIFQGICFVFIWVGLIIYTVEALHWHKKSYRKPT